MIASRFLLFCLLRERFLAKIRFQAKGRFCEVVKRCECSAMMPRDRNDGMVLSSWVGTGRVPSDSGFAFVPGGGGVEINLSKNSLIGFFNLIFCIPDWVLELVN
jgi:hypothetical protein